MLRGDATDGVKARRHQELTTFGLLAGVHRTTLRDWIYAPPKRWQAYPGGVAGMKPPAFSWWVFDCLGAQRGDELADLFPGSGAVARAWERYMAGEPSAEYSEDASRAARGLAA